MGEEGEEVEEDWLDAVVDVSAAALASSGSSAGLVTNIRLVETKEESVVDIILRHAPRHTQSCSSCWWQVTIVEPGYLR